MRKNNLNVWCPKVYAFRDLCPWKWNDSIYDFLARGDASEWRLSDFKHTPQSSVSAGWDVSMRNDCSDLINEWTIATHFWMVQLWCMRFCDNSVISGFGLAVRSQGEPEMHINHPQFGAGWNNNLLPIGPPNPTSLLLLIRTRHH